MTSTECFLKSGNRFSGKKHDWKKARVLETTANEYSNDRAKHTRAL
jgi:hypothetical protein